MSRSLESNKGLNLYVLQNIELILFCLFVFSQFIDWLFSLTEAPEDSLSQTARGETLVKLCYG